MGTLSRVTAPRLLHDILELGVDEHSKSPDSGSWGGSAHALELLLLHNDRLVATQKHGPWRRHIVGGTQAAYRRKNSFQRC